MERDKKQIILDYVAANPEPKIDKTPIPIIEYAVKLRGKNEFLSKHYYPLTGKVYTGDLNSEDKAKEPTREYFMSPTSKSYPFRWMQYIDYDRTNEMLRLSYITMKCNKPDAKINSDKRKWEFVEDTKWINTIFLFKGDSTPYNQHGEPLFQERQGKFYNLEFVRELKDFCKFRQCNATAQEFRDFFDLGKPKTGYYREAEDYYWGRVNVYKNMQSRSESKSVKELKELESSLSLTKLDDIAALYPIKYGRDKDGKCFIKTDFCYFEKVNDEVGVVRFLQRAYKDRPDHKIVMTVAAGDTFTKEAPFDREPYRIYINKDKVKTVKYEYSTKEYKIYGGEIRGGYGFYDANFDNIYGIKYFKDREVLIKEIIEKMSKSSTSGCTIIPDLLPTLASPVPEILLNDKLYNLYKIIGTGRGITGRTKDLFKVNSTSKKKDYSLNFGMNKAQLNKIETEFNNYTSTKTIIEILKLAYGQDISGFTAEETKNRFNTATIIYEHFGTYWKSKLGMDGYYWFEKDINEEDKEYLRKFINLMNGDVKVLACVTDFIQKIKHCSKLTYADRVVIYSKLKAISVPTFEEFKALIIELDKKYL